MPRKSADISAAAHGRLNGHAGEFGTARGVDKADQTADILVGAVDDLGCVAFGVDTVFEGYAVKLQTSGKIEVADDATYGSWPVTEKIWSGVDTFSA